MEHLSKHQLILVALLVSFVTSLATGIVTVALMDQAPEGVTRTITQVIQQTVAEATGPSSSAVATISVNDQVANATAAVSTSIVRLRDGDAGFPTALGLIVSPSGTIMADKSVIDSMENPQAVYPNGTAIPISLARFQVQGGIAFLKPTRPLAKPAKPIIFGEAARLGATVWSLSGTSTFTLSQGIVSRIDGALYTSIPGSDVMPGAPLFDAAGAVVGIDTQSFVTSANAAFYPVQGLKAGIPQ